MIHGFLRYIFAILPLFLALEPDASSDSMNEIRTVYNNILRHDIINLEKISNQDVAECKLCNTRVVSRNSTKNKTTGRNATASKWSNATVVACSSDQERAIYFLARCLQRLSRTCPSQLKHSMETVSNQTIKLLKKNGNATTAQSGRCCHGIKNCRKLDPISCIKNIVSDFRSCWIQFIN